MQRIKLSDEAEKDLVTSFIWYEEQRIGLGGRFIESVEQSLQVIEQFPKAFPIIFRKKVRRYPIKGFPFIILFIIRTNYVDVLGVYHTHRNPKVWKKRVR